MEAIQVQPMKADYAEALAEMLNNAGYPGWAADYRRWRPRTPGPCELVALRAGVPVGLIMGWHPRDGSEEPWGREIPAPHAMIGRIVTGVEHRREGIGAALLSAYCSWVAERGGRSILAEVADGGSAAAVQTRREFFLAHGLRRLTHPDRHIMGASLEDLTPTARTT